MVVLHWFWRLGKSGIAELKLRVALSMECGGWENQESLNLKLRLALIMESKSDGFTSALAAGKIRNR